MTIRAFTLTLDAFIAATVCAWWLETQAPWPLGVVVSLVPLLLLILILRSTRARKKRYVAVYVPVEERQLGETPFVQHYVED